jgi:DNA-binding FadR family transcriptional regulator
MKQSNTIAISEYPSLIGRSVDGVNGGTKLAEVVSNKIQMNIIDRGWPVGDVIGSEADLLAEYRVSRAVLREAVRLLEHDNVAYMRRGPGGGLVVAEPDPAPVTLAAAVYLRYKSVGVAELFEARIALESAAVRAAVERIDEYGVNRLREALAYEEGFTERADATIHDFHLVVAELSDNPALELFSDALTKLSAAGFLGTRAMFDRHAAVPRPANEIAETHRAHTLIADAIIAGDAALAQHRMHSHLRAMAAALDAAVK